jgi:hypothetical protein
MTAKQRSQYFFAHFIFALQLAIAATVIYCVFMELFLLCFYSEDTGFGLFSSVYVFPTCFVCGLIGFAVTLSAALKRDVSETRKIGRICCGIAAIPSLILAFILLEKQFSWFFVTILISGFITFLVGSWIYTYTVTKLRGLLVE